MDARALSDHVEITQLLYRYAEAVDTRELGLLETVFAPGAVIDYNVPGGASLTYPDVVEWLRQVLAIFRTTQHSLSNPIITVDGDTATAATYLTAPHVQVTHDGEELHSVQYGVYRDRLARTARGWRITERRFDARYAHGRFLGPDKVQTFPTPVTG